MRAPATLMALLLMGMHTVFTISMSYQSGYWEQKNELSPEDYGLFVKEIWVDGGKMLKRFQPAPQGRAHRIRKRSNHITVILDSKIPVEAK